MDEDTAEFPAINEPTPTEGVEQEDGSVEWPTDPDFVPTGVGQDLTPVEVDDDWEPSDEDDEDDESLDDGDDDWTEADDG